MIALLLFWLSAAAMVHSYLLYPLLLKLFSAGKKENETVFAADDALLPEVFVIFSVYNEDKVIAEKLESIFNTTYPLNKLEVHIGSDNSTDSTNSIITAFAAMYPQVYFSAFTERNGKAGVINKLVRNIQQRGFNSGKDVFVLTDANVMFTPGTIYQLVKHFKNESIAQTGANILNKGVKQDGISFQEKSYISIENNIKYLEGLNWGSMTGAFGACYAIRASSWPQIPPSRLMEDFYISMSVLAEGKKAIFEKQAVCYEDVSNEVAEEFKRKARIQAGNFQNLATFYPLLFRFNAVAFCFFSHKVIRWLGPLFILFTYVANFFLLPCGLFYLFTFIGQTFLLLSPVFDWLLRRMGIHLVIIRFASYFIMMNIALAKGFWMYMKGIKTSTWEPTKRNIEK